MNYVLSMRLPSMRLPRRIVLSLLITGLIIGLAASFDLQAMSPAYAVTPTPQQNSQSLNAGPHDAGTQDNAPPARGEAHAQTVAGPAPGLRLIHSYLALLSEQDHFNSYGQRLTSAAAIIRQDRANFHKFGQRDQIDETDEFFASKANRARMERMLKRGRASQRVINQIVNHTPIVRVNIYGKGNRGTYIEVLLQ